MKMMIHDLTFIRADNAYKCQKGELVPILKNIKLFAPKVL